MAYFAAALHICKTFPIPQPGYAPGGMLMPPKGILLKTLISFLFLEKNLPAGSQPKRKENNPNIC